MNVWSILGIQASGDEREIKRAYARALKTARPDEDPQRFQDLRAAYETALRIAREAADAAEPAPAVAAQPDQPVNASAKAPAYVPTWDQTPEDVARRVWAAFLLSWAHQPALGLKALDAGGDLLDLAVRDSFELNALRYCAGEDCPTQLRLAMADYFGWSHDSAFIDRELPDQAATVLALLRAQRSWEFFSERAASDAATRVLLGLEPCSAWALSDKRFTENLRALVRQIRWEHGEMLHFKLDRTLFERVESKANAKRYFRQTAIQSAITGFALWFLALLLQNHLSTYLGSDGLLLAATQTVSFAAFAWFAFRPPAIFDSAAPGPWNDRLYALLHHTRYLPQWQYGWMGVFAMASLWMFVTSPGAVLVATLQVTLFGCALASGFANSAVFARFTFLIAGTLAFLIGVPMSQGSFAAYGVLNCCLATFCGVMLAYRGGADLLDHFAVPPAAILAARAAWMAGAAGFITLAGTLPLTAQTTNAAAWAWLMAGMVLTRPTIHHFFAMFGALVLNGMAGALLNHSPLIHSQPMRSISFGMLFIGIFMAVNMARARTTQSQFS